MNSDPAELNGVRQCGFELIGNESACVPTRASVQHVEDDVLVDEQEVALDLFIECISDIHTTHVVRARLGPHPAHLAGVADLGDQVENLIWDSDSFQKPAHDLRGGVPPANVKLPQCEPVGSYSARSEEPDYSANVKVRPVGRILRVLAGASPRAPISRNYVGSSTAGAAITAPSAAKVGAIADLPREASVDVATEARAQVAQLQRRRLQQAWRPRQRA